MPRRKRFTDEQVAALQRKPKRYTFPDPEQPCLYVRVQPSGSKSFVVVTHAGKRWHTIGDTNTYTIDDARDRARQIIQAARDGVAAPESFAAIADKWREMHVQRKGLRSASVIDLQLRRLKDEFVGRDFTSIKRRDVANLLDKLAKENGERSADYALQVFSGMANWYATRDDDYTSPIVRGITRRNQKENARERILNDDELRAIWKAAEANGTFGAMVRLLLLTAQRRDKVATMRWDDISPDGVWSIPTEKREKGNAGELVLPQVALDIINAQPRFTDNDYVFAGRGPKHYHAFSNGKNALEAKLPDVPQWQLHDLRRTARSLMARAGVYDDHAERVLGHVQPGVQGIYNRHEYKEEKAQALKALASMIESILNPQTKESNVHRMARR